LVLTVQANKCPEVGLISGYRLFYANYKQNFNTSLKEKNITASNSFNHALFWDANGSSASYETLLHLLYPKLHFCVDTNPSGKLQFITLLRDSPRI